MEHKVAFYNGIQVSALGQGTWKMGQSAAHREQEMRALRRGIDLGLNVIDTAEMYDNEEMVGKVIHDCRDEVFLVSKVLPGNASYCGTKLACERSLQKLGTDTLDLYLLHWRGNHPYAETVRAMTELQQEGKIQMWGVSNMDVDDMERFYAIPNGRNCASNQVVYNLANRGVEYDLLPWSAANKIPIMAYSPVGEGRLVRNRHLEEVAHRHDTTPAQIALAWTMRLPNVIAIPKAGSINHVEENHRSLSIHLTEEDLRDLDVLFPAPTRKVPLAGW